MAQLLHASARLQPSAGLSLSTPLLLVMSECCCIERWEILLAVKSALSVQHKGSCMQEVMLVPCNDIRTYSVLTAAPAHLALL